MPGEGQQQKLNAQGKNMSQLCNAMKTAYHRGENFEQYLERMRKALDEPADLDVIPEKYKKYLITDEAKQKQRAVLTQRIREMKIEECTMEGVKNSEYDYYICRVIPPLEYYMKSMGDEKLFREFRNEMAERENRSEQIIRRRADGETRDEATEAVDAQRREKAYKRGRLAAQIAENFSKTTAEMLAGRKDVEIVDAYKTLQVLHHFSTGIANYLMPDYSGDYILFSDEDRKTCQHMAELYDSTHEYMAQIGMIFNPYYAYLDTEKMISDMSVNKNLKELALDAHEHYTDTYFAELEKTMYEGAQAKKEQVQKEANREGRTRLEETLRLRGIDPEKAQMTYVADETVFEIGVDDEIEKFRDGKEILVSYGSEVMAVRQKKGENAEIEVTYWPETAVRRLEKALKDRGINPEQAEFTGPDGKNISPEDENWSYYITNWEDNPVIVKAGNREMEIRVDEDMKPRFQYTAGGAVAELEETVRTLGFRAVYARFYNDKGKLVDLRTDAAKEYLLGGGKITVKEGEKSADIAIVQKREVSFLLNDAAIRNVFEIRLRDLDFALRDTVCTKTDGTVLDLEDENDLRYLREGNPVTATCGSRQAAITCAPDRMPEAVYTVYHKDNEKRTELVKEEKDAMDAALQAQTDAFGNTRPQALEGMAARVQAADPLRLKFTGSPEYRQMKQALTEYIRACSRLHKADLEDSEKRRHMEQLACKLFISAKAYTKMKGNHPTGKFGRVRLAAAQETERYAYAQIGYLDRIADIQKKTNDVKAEKTALESKIAAEKPTAVKKRKVMKNPHPSNWIREENERQLREEFRIAGRSFCDSHRPLRLNANLEKICGRMREQFGDAQKGIYEKCGMDGVSSADRKIPAAAGETVQEFLLDTIVADFVREEQRAAGDGKIPEKTGAYERMTQEQESLEELRRRIKETVSFQKEMQKMTRRDIRTYIYATDDGESLVHLTRRIKSEMKKKLDEDLIDRTKQTENTEKIQNTSENRFQMN